MTKVTIDLNVVLDFLNQRKDHKNAAQLIDLCEQRKIQGFLAAHEMTTLAYFLSREHGKIPKVNKILNEILDLFSILPVNETILRRALGSELKDFEDAVVDESSFQGSIDYIVTNNLKDFQSSHVKSMSPREFLLWHEV